ncbi:hypothetical protein NLI96_g9450 [Meripilus lineatus]|uniref:Uncharacterized protein n=1 Tax=Meripilus lineatus TaxID=2056292 RepID=A0AAD5UVF0_9APHY|nr:hypothetical protein NLI96_g9450 [Physisporinus lineatus]
MSILAHAVPGVAFGEPTVIDPQNLTLLTVHQSSIAIIMKTTFMLLLALSLVVSNVAALPTTEVAALDAKYDGSDTASSDEDYSEKVGWSP